MDTAYGKYQRAADAEKTRTPYASSYDVGLLESIAAL
jgi:hypothetical protein